MTSSDAEMSPGLGEYSDGSGGFIVGDAGRAYREVKATRDGQFPDVADFVADGDTVGQGEVIVRAASVRGLSHRYSGLVRQDAYSISLSSDGECYIAIVADGVSSGQLSHIAARTAATSGRSFLESLWSSHGARPDRAAWAEAIGSISDTILRTVADECEYINADAITDGRHLRAVASTTLVGLMLDIRPDGNGVLSGSFASVGDSSVWTYDQSQWNSTVRIAAEPAYTTNVTQALPNALADSAALVIQNFSLEPGSLIVLMTDGVAGPLADGSGEVGRFLASSWSRPPRPLTFAAQLDFGRRSFDDDRTAVALWNFARGGCGD